MYESNYYFCNFTPIFANFTSPSGCSIIMYFIIFAIHWAKFEKDFSIIEEKWLECTSETESIFSFLIMVP